MNKPIHPAVAEHVMAENQTLRQALQAMLDECDPMKLNCGEPWCRARAALSQQAEPDDDVPDFSPGSGNRARRRMEALGIPFAGFDPAFCPGSNPENPQTEPVEPAPAQDEREKWNVALLQVAVVLEALRSTDSAARLANMNAAKVLGEAYAKLKDIRATHRAQTEQQPVPDAVWEALQRMIETTHQLGPHSQEDAQLVARYRDRYRLLAAPVAQAEQQPIYQIRPRENVLDWLDTNADVYRAARAMASMETRKLYAAPVAHKESE